MYNSVNIFISAEKITNKHINSLCINISIMGIVEYILKVLRLTYYWNSDKGYKLQQNGSFQFYNNI